MKITWNELSERDQIGLVLEHVMGCFLDTPITDHQTSGFLPAPTGFQWPVAYWNILAGHWIIRDRMADPVAFDPLRDMNSAWRIVEHFRGTADVHVASAPYQYDAGILDRKAGKQYFASAASAQEAICLVALRAKGIEIIRA